jgi:hypothetical protein
VGVCVGVSSVARAGRLCTAAFPALLHQICRKPHTHASQQPSWLHSLRLSSPCAPSLLPINHLPFPLAPLPTLAPRTVQLLSAEPEPVYGCLMFPCVAKGSSYYDEPDVESKLVQVGMNRKRCKTAVQAPGWCKGVVPGQGWGWRWLADAVTKGQGTGTGERVQKSTCVWRRANAHHG